MTSSFSMLDEIDRIRMDRAHYDYVWGPREPVRRIYHYKAYLKAHKGNEVPRTGFYYGSLHTVDMGRDEALMRIWHYLQPAINVQVINQASSWNSNRTVHMVQVTLHGKRLGDLLITLEDEFVFRMSLEDHLKAIVRAQLRTVLCIDLVSASEVAPSGEVARSHGRTAPQRMQGTSTSEPVDLSQTPPVGSSDQQPGEIDLRVFVDLSCTGEELAL
jgi:hypothetical protein